MADTDIDCGGPKRLSVASLRAVSTLALGFRHLVLDAER